jgi:hypothetical protein
VVITLPKHITDDEERFVPMNGWSANKGILDIIKRHSDNAKVSKSEICNEALTEYAIKIDEVAVLQEYENMLTEELEIVRKKKSEALQKRREKTQLAEALCRKFIAGLSGRRKKVTNEEIEEYLRKTVVKRCFVTYEEAANTFNRVITERRDEMERAKKEADIQRLKLLTGDYLDKKGEHQEATQGESGAGEGSHQESGET